MYDNMENIKKSIKEKRHIKTQSNYMNNSIINKFYKFINKILILTVVTLVIMIILKSNLNIRNSFYKYVYDSHLSFAPLNELYQKHFGSPLPFKNLLKDNITPVFNETLQYKEINKYKNCAKLIVDNNYLVPSIDKGIVIFTGDKDDYFNMVIIQQSNNVDVWYSNLNNINVKLYDYVKKGDLIGETINNELYLCFKKDGRNIDYNQFIP